MIAKQTTPRLGRGLAALFGETPNRDRIEGDDVRQLPIDLLDPNPFQPRTSFDEVMLGELADSIRSRGVLQPILVRQHPDIAERYQIIAGERRWRASAIAGLHHIPVICRVLNDIESAAAALIENLQRENLNPLEEAEGYRRLIQNFQLTHEALGAAVGKSRAHIGNILRLLILPEVALEHLRSGALTLGHARAILTLPDPVKIIPEVIGKNLSVRQTERLVRRLMPRSTPLNSEPNAAQIENDIALQIGHRIKVSTLSDGSGTLKILFDDLFQLDDLISRLKVSGECQISAEKIFVDAVVPTSDVRN